MKIYTKTGDKGETSLFGGKRVSKADLRVEALGAIDELNSVIGIVLSELRIKNQESSINKELINIQKDLFKISSILAGSTIRYTLPFGLAQGGDAKRLEQMIDELSKELPEIRNFILPGGGKAGSLLHFCRSICRRVERKIVDLSAKESVDQKILIYFNRLSDLIFVMARYINYKEKEKEIIIG